MMHKPSLGVALAALLACAAGQAAAHGGDLTACAASRTASLTYMGRAVAAARQLQVPPDYPRSHRLALEPEADTLSDAGRDVYGRRLRLAPDAAVAWRDLRAAARRDGVVLQALSGFRSFRYQRQLLARKLHRPDMDIGSALRVNAAPGFSEHHTGCAIDLTTPGAPAADTAFAATPAYRWLLRHAALYGFQLSYAASNAHGIAFEPWHWRYVTPAAAMAANAP